MTQDLVPMIDDQEEQTIAVAIRPHFGVYGWVYVVFAILTALAVYAMLRFPQAGI